MDALGLCVKKVGAGSYVLNRNLVATVNLNYVLLQLFGGWGPLAIGSKSTCRRLLNASLTTANRERGGNQIQCWRAKTRAEKRKRALAKQGEAKAKGKAGGGKAGGRGNKGGKSGRGGKGGKRKGKKGGGRA